MFRQLSYEAMEPRIMLSGDGETIGETATRYCEAVGSYLYNFVHRDEGGVSVSDLLPRETPEDVRYQLERIIHEAQNLAAPVVDIRIHVDPDLMRWDYFDDWSECGLLGPCGAFTEKLAQWVSDHINLHDDRFEITAWALAKEHRGYVQNVIKFEYFSIREPDASFVVYIDNTYFGGDDCCFRPDEINGEWLEKDFLTITADQMREMNTAQRLRQIRRIEQLNQRLELESQFGGTRVGDRHDRRIERIESLAATRDMGSRFVVGDNVDRIRDSVFRSWPSV